MVVYITVLIGYRVKDKIHPKCAFLPFHAYSRHTHNVREKWRLHSWFVSPSLHLVTFHNFSSARSESFVDGGGGAAAVLAHHGAIIVGVWRISPDLNGVKCPLIVTAHGGEGYASALLFLPHEVTI